MERTEVELLHDLGMPLQLILSSAQLLKQAMGDPSLPAEAYLDMLLDSAGQMQRMLTGAMASCNRTLKSERPPRRRPLSRCLRELCLRCAPYAEQRGVRLRCRGDEGLSMPVDEEALSRVLLNLISNALRFTPRGGEIAVEWAALGDAVEIAVADTGCGIAPERLSAVFAWGETDGGHGYGLASARDCARRMGGGLIASSRPGAGSRFVLRLPFKVANDGGGADVGSG